MIHPDWSKIQHSIPVTSVENGDDFLQRTSFEIQDLLHRTISKLLDRAHALILDGNLEWALNDYAAIRTLDPTSSKGYLYAAMIYNQQGHQQTGIDICHEGLRIVPSSDPAYAILQLLVANSEAPNRKRVDFITLLPMDIVSRIASKIFTNGIPSENPTQYPCLQVSRIWKNRLLEAYNAHELHIINCKAFDKWYPHIERYGSIITSLTTAGCIQASYELLEKTTFPSLTMLSVNDTNMEKETYMMTRMMFTLQQMPMTLTDLTIMVPTMLPIASILDALPFLSSLECSSIAVDPIMLHSFYPNMQTFKLHCEKYATYETASCILPRFPSLHTLLFEAVTDRFAEIMAQLPGWCPSLRHINLGKEHPIDHHTMYSGITIILAIAGTSFNGKDIIAFLEHYAPLIENFIFQSCLVDFPKHYISSVQFKRMKNMQIHYNDLPDPRERLCEWMLRHAPRLETFRVHDASAAGVRVLNAMTRLAWLQVAEIPFSWDTIQGQIWFLKHHCILGPKSNLRCLVIRMVGTCITGYTSPLLAGLKHLKELKIIEDGDGGVFQQTPRLMFENLVRGYISLTHLTLDALKSIDKSVIEAVSKSKSIKHLTLVADEMSHIAINHLLLGAELKTVHLWTSNTMNQASDSGIHEKVIQLIVSTRASR
ncbi:hypothetical protein K492DRAFT_200446 [Lichtheimia hyalospora FSU 10163]|nr:hypothetical protein K492DRAFT_200446 [Lichtheimia hyalospora FSU 10163]